MADESSAIRIDNISKSFGRAQVLSSFSIDIAAGEFFSLLGPSGCGKSTLLNILGGLVSPDSGRILIGGDDVTGLPPEHRPTNMVFQNYAIFPHLSVERNVAYGLRRKRLDRDQLKQRVDEMLDLVHLGGMAKRKPDQLSGGQQQRVALARALVMQPRVLLLDESLAALDKRLRQSMQVELRQLQRAIGITFVFVTHDQDEALAMSDRIAVMGSGEILQLDTPTRLYREPSSREVAEFIGSINLFPVNGMQERDGQRILDGGALGLFQTDCRATSLIGKKGRFLAVRPESVRVETQQRTDTTNRLQAHVLETIFLGDRHFVRARVDHHDEPVMASCPFETANRIEKGQTVWLCWDADAGRIVADR